MFTNFLRAKIRRRQIRIRLESELRELGQVLGNSPPKQKSEAQVNCLVIGVALLALVAVFAIGFFEARK